MPMVLLLPLLLPWLAAAAVIAARRPRNAVRLALTAGALELGAIGWTVERIHAAGVVAAGPYLRADALTSFFLLAMAAVFTLALVYSVGYLRHVPAGRFASVRWYYALTYLFLFTMLAVFLSANLGLMWIFMEATTLASALLVGFYNTEGAVEAGWKYLMVCTVGLAFALFGTILLYLAAVRGGIPGSAALDWAGLEAAGARLRGGADLVKLAFVFLAVGYGTKAGFVPMHSWLPDAHAEAPSPTSALLSAGLLNCAFYALLRFTGIAGAVIGGGFAHHVLLGFGLVSLVLAALLLMVQRDMKRLLAYSSIEHIGIAAIGVGLGTPLALAGALLHLFNHALAKTMLFFAAGNVRERYGGAPMSAVTGLARALPFTGGALIAGGAAIAGLPPFGLFVSEFMIVAAAFAAGRYWVAAVTMAAIAVAFAALLRHLQPMLGGEGNAPPERHRPWWPGLAAIAVCAAGLLVLGIHIPAAFSRLLAAAVGAARP